MDKQQLLRTVLVRVSQFTMVPIHEIASKPKPGTGTGKVREARKLYYHLAYTRLEKFGVTYQEIAEYIGRTNHATVLLGSRSCADWLETDKNFRYKYGEFVTNFKIDGYQVYLAGNDDGLMPYEKKEKFAEIEEKLIQIGYQVFNHVTQIPAGPDNLRFRLQNLLRSEAIFLMDDWHFNRNAWLENEVASNIDMPIFTRAIFRNLNKINKHETTISTIDNLPAGNNLNGHSSLENIPQSPKGCDTGSGGLENSIYGELSK